jgi:hypothetical protein
MPPRQASGTLAPYGHDYEGGTIMMPQPVYSQRAGGGLLA